MFKEVPGEVIDQGRRRRAFTDADLHLYYWTEPDGTPFGFQLLYWVDSRFWARVRDRLSFMWTREEGYLHHQVTHVEGGSEMHDPGADMTTLPPGRFDREALLKRLRSSAAGLEPGIERFVLDKLENCPKPS